jgi:hypothetical protein
MATAQSVTSQPARPWRSVRRTVSSTAAKKASGIEPSSASIENATPEPAGVGSMRRPTVARNGLGGLRSRSTAAPVPTGRSMRMVVVSRKPTSRPKSSASVAPMTSFWTSP